MLLSISLPKSIDQGSNHQFFFFLYLTGGWGMVRAKMLCHLEEWSKGWVAPSPFRHFGKMEAALDATK